MRGKPLLILILTVVAIGFLLWLAFRPQPGRDEAEVIVRSDVDSTRIWQMRFDSLHLRSISRDSAIQRDSIEEIQQEAKARTLLKNLVQIRVELAQAAGVRDSLREYARLDTFQTNLHLTDSFRIDRLVRQRDALRLDRDEWKRFSADLRIENVRLTKDILRLGSLARDRCQYLFITVPCPKIVIGPTGAVNATGHVTAGLGVTAGFPLSLKKEQRPSRMADPIVSEMELVPSAERYPTAR